MKETIETLQSKMDILSKDIDGIRETSLKGVTSMDGFEDAWEEYIRLSADKRNEYSDLLFEVKKLEEPEWKDIPEYGDLMTLKQFKANVKCGGFIDYDGFGNYATKTKCSNIEIIPSDIEANRVLENKKFTHVVWYNR